MEVKNENQSILTREIKIVPQWVALFAAIAFVAVQIPFHFLLSSHHNDLPAWARTPIGLIGGIVVAAYILLLGYVNRDAKRRGMSPTLWTLVALFIPNALGFLLYFVLRQPMRQLCPNCGNSVQAGFNFCPRCSHKLAPSCPQCQRVVGSADVYCPYCGTSLQAKSVNVT